MKKATIYTGKGDNGTTSLIGNEIVPKNHPRVEAYGTLDELNAHLGLLTAALTDTETRKFIEHIENEIITLGSYLANPEAPTCPVDATSISMLEKAIDTLEAQLPPMHHFILPPGNEAAARAGVCRTVCRRAERRLVTLCENSTIESNAMIFVNRLSDYLFLLQRELTESEEKIWQKPCE